MTPPSKPRTAAGRALDNRLSFDASPEGYLPGDYLDEYREAILAIEAEANWIDVPPETEAVRRCVTHHACACHERLAEIGRRYIKAYEAEP
jgi:hypothetical protein